MTHNRNKATTYWTLAITSLALFMVSLDNLVVTTALPVIRRELHASISQLEWTVNAYTLTFAVLLLTGAALGDRFGRRRMFVLGMLLFTGASAAAALATTANALDIASAIADTPAQVPIARPRSWASNVLVMIESVAGIMQPEPTPCRARNAISHVSLCDSAIIRLEAPKIVTPTMNMRRRPNRSPSLPPVTSSTANDSV